MTVLLLLRTGSVWLLLLGLGLPALGLREWAVQVLLSPRASWLGRGLLGLQAGSMRLLQLPAPVTRLGLQLHRVR